jgi:hypothetical protein
MLVPGLLWRLTFLAFPNPESSARPVPRTGRDEPEGWAGGRAAPGAGNAAVIRCSKTGLLRRQAQPPYAKSFGTASSALA